MSGLSLHADVHVYTGAVIRQAVFPESNGGAFVSVKIHAASPNSTTGMSLLITEPDVLAALAATMQAARDELIAAKTAAEKSAV